MFAQTCSYRYFIGDILNCKITVPKQSHQSAANSDKVYIKNLYIGDRNNQR